VFWASAGGGNSLLFPWQFGFAERVLKITQKMSVAGILRNASFLRQSPISSHDMT
jgi:hypothetical protein